MSPNLSLTGQGGAWKELRLGVALGRISGAADMLEERGSFHVRLWGAQSWTEEKNRKKKQEEPIGSAAETK